MTTGPAGSYSYDGAHLDAVTATSGGYTGSYDDAGDLQCRAPNSSQTCQGTQTGQQLSYDQLRRLLNWQNATSNPTVRAHYAYDGENERVIQNTGPVTYYLGGYTEVTVNGSSTTTTNYYGAGVSTAVAVNGTITYLVADGIGSASESLSSSGSVQGAQLFAPYGSVRYTTGSMSTAKGFTGQLSDPSGLSYFHARYYDPVVGQFGAADRIQGLNRYGYVSGNPMTYTDPTGQYISAPGCPQCTAFVSPGGGKTYVSSPPPPCDPNTSYVKNGTCVSYTDSNRQNTCKIICDVLVNPFSYCADHTDLYCKGFNAAISWLHTAQTIGAVIQDVIDVLVDVGDLIADPANKAWDIVSIADDTIRLVTDLVDLFGGHIPDVINVIIGALQFGIGVIKTLLGFFSFFSGADLIKGAEQAIKTGGAKIVTLVFALTGLVDISSGAVRSVESVVGCYVSNSPRDIDSGKVHCLGTPS